MVMTLPSVENIVAGKPSRKRHQKRGAEAITYGRDFAGLLRITDMFRFWNRQWRQVGGY